MSQFKQKRSVFIMYYSAGTYEAFARPEKPEGADRKSAYPQNLFPTMHKKRELS